MKYILPILFILSACGVARQHDNNDPIIPPVGGCNRPSLTPGKATLVLFGAPPCENCHISFPKIAKLVNAANVLDLKVRLYVETGGGWTDGPTAMVTRNYANALGLCVDEMSPDSTDKKHHPSYENYTKYTGVDISEANLPAAVILDQNGNVVQRFTAGTTFTPELIVNQAVIQARK